MRAFDQTGHIGDHERLLVRLLAHRHHAQIRLERGERVVRNLGLGSRNPRNQRRLSGIRIPDQPHIGQQFQFQPVESLLALPPQFVLARCLVGAGGKVLIAASPTSAFGNDQALIRLGKIVYKLAGFLVVKRCSHRYLQHD